MFSINNGDGTFTDVTEKAGVRDGRWSTGAAFADYDGDGFVDLMVANYLDSNSATCPVRRRRPGSIGARRAVRAAGMPARAIRYFGWTFSDVSKAAGVNDPNGFYGMGVAWADFAMLAGRTCSWRMMRLQLLLQE
jgi:hypothetical protein